MLNVATVAKSAITVIRCEGVFLAIDPNLLSLKGLLDTKVTDGLHLKVESRAKEAHTALTISTTRDKSATDTVFPYRGHLMKNAGNQEIVILAAKRTAFGTFGGALKKQSATDLGVTASRAAIAQAGVNPDHIDHVIFGNVMQTSVDAIYLARHIGLRCEIPQAVPALTVNRLCGSGFQAIINGAEQILLGDASCVLVGGTENMSQAPHVIRGCLLYTSDAADE